MNELNLSAELNEAEKALSVILSEDKNEIDSLLEEKIASQQSAKLPILIDISTYTVESNDELPDVIITEDSGGGGFTDWSQYFYESSVQISVFSLFDYQNINIGTGLGDTAAGTSFEDPDGTLNIDADGDGVFETSIPPVVINAPPVERTTDIHARSLELMRIYDLQSDKFWLAVDVAATERALEIATFKAENSEGFIQAYSYVSDAARLVPHPRAKAIGDSILAAGTADVLLASERMVYMREYLYDRYREMYNLSENKVILVGDVNQLRLQI